MELKNINRENPELHGKKLRTSNTGIQENNLNTRMNDESNQHEGGYQTAQKVQEKQNTLLPKQGRRPWRWRTFGNPVWGSVTSIEKPLGTLSGGQLGSVEDPWRIFSGG
ncbi:hypothetical protein ILYODFUR_032890 [Ilyodon furcidens]|uniref:Uncharacterized protein n=1 Tax=Ilyodon furcidens TaxID=33524 RepID=A0ABV0TQL9_9TELE